MSCIGLASLSLFKPDIWASVLGLRVVREVGYFL